MTPEQIDAALAQCNAATGGPWEAQHDTYGDEWWFGGEGAGQHTVRSPGAYPHIVTDGEHGADAAFIAAARTGWPEALHAIQRVLALHSPYGIYDECDCTQEQKDDDERGTHVHALDIGTTCNLKYFICRECCCDGNDREYQTEDCANYHEHTLDKQHRCGTVRAITGGTDEG